MADNSDDPVMANQDVIQAARGIRRNPAQLAAMAPPAEDDPNTAGMATHGSPGGPIGETVVQGKPQSAPSPQTVRALATAIASAPMPPPRPADLGGAPCTLLRRRLRLRAQRRQCNLAIPTFH